MTIREPLNAGVIGWPIGHSISPQFQQAAFNHLGIDARYEAHAVKPEEVRGFFDRLRRGGWLGCNVTIPHKATAAECVDELTPEAQAIGVVNTVIVQGDRLVGHNTDATGFMRALTEDGGFDARGKDAMLLGAGGAAMAVAIGLAGAGVRRLWIANRSVERAQALAELTRAGTGRGGHGTADVQALPLDAGALRAPIAEATLLVNTTSVGMRGGPAPAETPLPPELLGSHLLVYDLVYNPARTPLLEAAARADARTLEGLPMLVYQGAAAFERWTGQPAPADVMLATARRALAERMAAQH